MAVRMAIAAAGLLLGSVQAITVEFVPPLYNSLRELTRLGECWLRRDEVPRTSTLAE